MKANEETLDNYMQDSGWQPVSVKMITLITSILKRLSSLTRRMEFEFGNGREVT